MLFERNRCRGHRGCRGVPIITSQDDFLCLTNEETKERDKGERDMEYLFFLLFSYMSVCVLAFQYNYKRKHTNMYT